MSRRAPYSIEAELACGKYPDLSPAELIAEGMSVASVSNAPMPSDPTTSAREAVIHMFDRKPRQQHEDVETAPSTSNQLSWAEVDAYLDKADLAYPAFSYDRQERARLEYRAQASRQVTGAGEALVRAMQVVPGVFFSPTFDLEDPATFARACPAVEDGEREQTVVTLTSHLDLVETLIEEEVSLRSDQFVAASGHVYSLTDDVKRVLERLRSFKSSLDWLDRESFRTALAVQQLQRRRSNIDALTQVAAMVADVASSMESFEVLRKEGEWTAALEVLLHLQALAADTAVSPLRCLSFLRPALEQGRRQICAGMVSALADAADCAKLSDVQDRIASTLKAAVASEGGLSGSLFPDSPADELGLYADLGVGEPPEANADGAMPPFWDVLHNTLWPLVTGLYRQGKLNEGLTVYKNAAVASLKSTLGSETLRLAKLLLQEGGGATPPDGTSFDEQLQWLRPSAFLAMLRALRELLRVALWYHRGVPRVVGNILLAKQVAPEEVERWVAAGQATLTAILEAFQARWAKLLASRFGGDFRSYAEPSAALDGPQPAPPGLPAFQEVVTLSASVEALCEAERQPAAALRMTLHTLCHDLMTGKAASLQSQLLMSLSGDLWTAAAVPHDVQAFVDELVAAEAALGGDAAAAESAAAAPDAGDGSDALSALTILSIVAPPAAGAEAPRAGGEDAPPAADALAVGPDRLFIVNSTVLLLRHVSTLMSFGAAFPSLRFEMAKRVAELLKLYNSRTCQLVLGAGAIAVAGLKSITARHMAICSQSLLALEGLMAALRHALLTGLPPLRHSTLAPTLDAVAQDLTIHRQQIQTKLVAVMRERLSRALHYFPDLSLAWGRAPKPPAEGEGARPPPFSSEPRVPVCDLISQMIQQLNTLKSVLAPVLAPSQLQDVFSRIARMYSDSIARGLRGLEPCGAGWTDAAINDISALLQCLEGLPVDRVDTHLTALCAFLSQLHEVQLTASPAAASPQAPEAAPEGDLPEAPADAGGATHEPEAAAASPAVGGAEDVARLDSDSFDPLAAVPDVPRRRDGSVGASSRSASPPTVGRKRPGAATTAELASAAAAAPASNGAAASARDAASVAAQVADAKPLARGPEGPTAQLHGRNAGVAARDANREADSADFRAGAGIVGHARTTDARGQPPEPRRTSAGGGAPAAADAPAGKMRAYLGKMFERTSGGDAHGPGAPPGGAAAHGSGDWSASGRRVGVDGPVAGAAVRNFFGRMASLGANAADAAAPADAARAAGGSGRFAKMWRGSEPEASASPSAAAALARASSDAADGLPGGGGGNVLGRVWDGLGRRSAAEPPRPDVAVAGRRSDGAAVLPEQPPAAETRAAALPADEAALRHADAAVDASQAEGGLGVDRPLHDAPAPVNDEQSAGEAYANGVHQRSGDVGAVEPAASLPADPDAQAAGLARADGGGDVLGGDEFSTGDDESAARVSAAVGMSAASSLSTFDSRPAAADDAADAFTVEAAAEGGPVAADPAVDDETLADVPAAGGEGGSHTQSPSAHATASTVCAAAADQVHSPACQERDVGEERPEPERLEVLADADGDPLVSSESGALGLAEAAVSALRGDDASTRAGSGAGVDDGCSLGGQAEREDGESDAASHTARAHATLAQPAHEVMMANGSDHAAVPCEGGGPVCSDVVDGTVSDCGEAEDLLTR